MTTVKQKVTPWEGVAGPLKQLPQLGAEIYNATPKTGYTGDFTVTDPNAAIKRSMALSTTAGNTAYRAGGAEIGQGREAVGGPGIATLNKTAGGGYLGETPELTNAISAAFRPLDESFTRSTLPAIRNASIANGAYGGNREGIAEGVAAGDLAKAKANAAAGLSFSNLTNERQLQQQAAIAAPSVGSSLIGSGITNRATGAGQVLGAGQIQEGYDQNKINNAIAQQQESERAPWAGFSNYTGSITPGSGFGTTATNNPTNNALGALQGGLGVGLAGAGIVNLLGGGGGLAGLLGLGAKAAPLVAGGALSSDSRLKRILRLVGKTGAGVPLYLFHYHHSPELHIGVIAQELQATQPDAVVEGEDGYLLVDYSKVE